MGDRFGAGEVLAVLRPGSLVDMWRALQVCVDHDLIVITQAANTGLTGGSGPGDQDYDRDIVIISTLRIDQIHLLHDAREAVCRSEERRVGKECRCGWLMYQGKRKHRKID